MVFRQRSERHPKPGNAGEGRHSVGRQVRKLRRVPTRRRRRFSIRATFRQVFRRQRLRIKPAHSPGFRTSYPWFRSRRSAARSLGVSVSRAFFGLPACGTHCLPNASWSCGRCRVSNGLTVPAMSCLSFPITATPRLPHRAPRYRAMPVLACPAPPRLAWPRPALPANPRRALRCRADPSHALPASPRRVSPRLAPPCPATPALFRQSLPCLAEPRQGTPA